MTADPASPSGVVRAGEGDRIPAAGVDHLFKLTGQHTAGLLGLEEFVVPPRTLGARPQVHGSHDVDAAVESATPLTDELLVELRSSYDTENG